jgi:hypothetical protein
MRALAVVFFALLSGCGIPLRNLDVSATPAPGGDEAVVVLAVEPRARVSLFEGERRGAEWTCTSAFNIASVAPEGGFIVLKLRPRMGSENYGIGQVLPDGVGGESFTVHRYSAVPAFHAPAGVVTFVGGVQLGGDDERLRMAPDASTTVEDAQRFLQASYPGLAGNVAYDPLVLLRADGGCG